MKKIIFLIMMLVFIPSIFAGTVTRTVSDSNPSSGDTITVTLSYSGGDQSLTVHEEAPSDVNYNTVTGTSLFGGTGNVLEYFLGTQAQITLPASSVTYKTTVSGTGTKTFGGKYQLSSSTTDKIIGGVTSITIGGDEPCTVTSWTPLTSTVCSGETFTQTSNCGDTKSATGTKTCDEPCTSSSACKSSTCVGSTCTDDCGNSYDGTKDCTVDDTCSSDDDCIDFLQKCETGKCNWNVGMIILLAVGLFLLKGFM